MTGFHADDERIAARAADFDDYVTQANDALARLRDALDGTGKPWGADMVGESFEAAHADAAGNAIAVLSGLGTGVGELGAKFAAAAAGYREADEVSADSIASAGHPTPEALD